MVTAKWGTFKFKVSKKKINSFTDLGIKGSIKTEEKTKTKNKQEVVVKKTTRATEISMTVHLYAATGCKVKGEAMKLVTAARKGKKGYLYVGGKKLVKCKLMLTEASVKEVTFYGKMKWYSADVALTFKQSKSSKNDDTSSDSSGGSSSGGSSGSSGGSAGSGSKKASVKTSSPKNSSGKIKGAASTVASSGVDGVTSAAPVKKAVKNATQIISETTRNAKATTKENKATVKTTVVFDKKYGKQVM